MNEHTYTMTCAGEEAVELALELAIRKSLTLNKRITKAIRFGMDENEPNDPLDNTARILEEANDLYAVLDMLGLFKPDPEAMERKKEKVRRYAEYARNCGTLIGDREEVLSA